MKIGKDIQRSSKDCQRSLYKKRYITHYNPSSNQPQDLSSIEILHSSDHPSMDPPMAIRILAHYFNKGCFLKSWGNTPQIIYFRIFMDCQWNQPYQPSSYIGVPPFMEPPYQHIPTNHLKVFSWLFSSAVATFEIPRFEIPRWLAIGSFCIWPAEVELGPWDHGTMIFQCWTSGGVIPR